MGKRHRTIWRSGPAVAFSGALVATALVAPPAMGVPGCAADCITSAKITPTPEGVGVMATTTPAAAFGIEVRLAGAPVASAGPAPSPATSHTRSVSGLKQRTWYTVVLSATDGSNNVRQETYSFRTPSRTATVAWGNVLVSDDSDPVGPGELMFGTRIGTKTTFDARYGTGTTPSTAPLSWVSGTTRTSPLVQAMLPGAPEALPLNYTIVDNDAGAPGKNKPAACWANPANPWRATSAAYSAFGSGSDLCAQWATASGALRLPSTIGTSVQTLRMASTSGARPRFGLSKVTVTTRVANVPSAPRSATATPFNTSARVSWKAPSTGNGAPIIRYSVKAGSGQACVAGAAERSCSVTGLANGTPVTFTVVATNSEGSSTAATTAPVTPVAVPDSPLITRAVAGDGRATITFATPAPGSPAVDSYCVYHSGRTSGCQTSSGQTAVVTGLTNGRSYQFWATATNTLGTSEASGISAAVTPVKPSAISGFDTAAATGAVGGSITDALRVTPSGAKRALYVQYRAVGSVGWTTAGTTFTDVAGNGTVRMAFKPGVTEWRVYATRSGAFGATASPTRTLYQRTTITGFDAAYVYTVTGATLRDAVVVSPGASRPLEVQVRASKLTPWKTLSRVVTNAKGAATISFTAPAGRSEWRVLAPASPLWGSAAGSPVKVVIAL